MIRLLTEEKKDEFLSFCSRFVLGVNIYTRLSAYGLDSSAQTFWYCENEQGICFALNKSENVLTVCGADFDCGEFRRFIPFTGCNIVLCSEAIGEKAGFKNCKIATVMKYTGNGETCFAEAVDSENIRFLYDVIEEESDIDYCYWLPDISHKIRHGLIRAFGVREKGKLVSSAVTSGECEDKSVISSVAVLREYRSKGYGKDTVMAIVNSLLSDGKEIYLITDSEKNIKWYKKMGFDKVESSVEYRVKDFIYE